jgi:hypothetical protein
MIEQVIHLAPDSPLVRSDPVREWLIDTLGPNAPSFDCVDTERPWAVEYRFGQIEIAFARATDATMFLLRWA